MGIRKKEAESNNSHIAAFIEKIKSQHSKNILDRHFYRQSVVYICRQFNGLSTDDIRSLISQGNSNSVRADVQTALELRANEHPGFMKIYWPILNQYINFTKELLPRSPNGIHVMLSAASKN